ncbi:hypothetical protein HZ326_13553 [Fusarium oxysporum f. sp. albedinis]|nr:hypothetical protein HZ326_13553 [Fusarium oxysporum f. sp. albedinis]
MTALVTKNQGSIVLPALHKKIYKLNKQHFIAERPEMPVLTVWHVVLGAFQLYTNNPYQRHSWLATCIFLIAHSSSYSGR